jgi:hypothetical protein
MIFQSKVSNRSQPRGDPLLTIHGKLDIGNFHQSNRVSLEYLLATDKPPQNSQW